MSVMSHSQGVRSLIRGLRVLEVVGQLQPVPLRDIAGELGEPKSSIQRLLATLESAEWVRRSSGPEQGWMLAQRVARLGARVDAFSLRDTALPVMKELRQTTNESIHLALAQPPSMLLIERIESKHPVRHVEPLGGLAPMALTASGRASLSTMSDDFITKALESDQSMRDEDHRARTLISIQRNRLDGYATTSEWRDGVHATAAPVQWKDGPLPPPTLSISAVLSRVDEKVQKLHAKLVIEAAHEIAMYL